MSSSGLLAAPSSAVVSVCLVVSSSGELAIASVTASMLRLAGSSSVSSDIASPAAVAASAVASAAPSTASAAPSTASVAASAAPSAASAAPSTASSTAVEEAVEGAAEAAEGAADAATEAVEGAAEAVEGAADATADAATAAGEAMSLDTLLDPANLNIEAVTEAIANSPLDETTKQTLTTALEGAANNPLLLNTVLDQIRAALQ